MPGPLFYTDTRWSNEGIELVVGYPDGYEMGNLAALLQWHYEDVPDAFERRRNQAVYSRGLNPSYYTNNRNAYVDRPEYVWSVFVDNENDTQLTTDATVLNLGKVIVGESLPTETIEIVKSGYDGTYFEVSTTGDATSTVSGRYNAFAMGGPSTRQIEVGLGGSTAAAGVHYGTVVIDNLDVTTGGGVGKGADDSDDVVTLLATVVTHANGSFSAEGNVDALTIDFGTVPQAGGVLSQAVSLWNLETVAGLTAGLDLDSISLISGDGDVLDTDLTPFSALAGGTSTSFGVRFDTSETGVFAADYRLVLSDEDIPGAESQILFLRLRGEVILQGDLNGDGIVGSQDLDIVRSHWLETVTPGDLSRGDASGDGMVGSADLDVIRGNWCAGLKAATVPVTVPEPAWWVLFVGLGAMARRR